MTFDEVIKVKLFVEDNKEFFSFLPDVYLKGNRTITRAQEYNADFPDHLPETRCIFGLENGACSLQLRAIELGLPQWEYKPEPCWLFPLRAEGGTLIYPFTVANRGYGNFMKGFPCGKRKPKKEWVRIMHEEISYFKELEEKERRDVVIKD